MTAEKRQTLHKILDAYLDKQAEQMEDGSYFRLDFAGHVNKVEIYHGIWSAPDEFNERQYESKERASAYWDTDDFGKSKIDDMENIIKAMTVMSWDEYVQRGGQENVGH